VRFELLDGEVSPRRHALVLELERSRILTHEHGSSARFVSLRNNALLRPNASPDHTGGTSVRENVWERGGATLGLGLGWGRAATGGADRGEEGEAV
jgi:hypothetical protein